MSYDAEVRCTLADAERDRNALVISASLVNLLLSSGMLLIVRWKMSLYNSFLTLNSSILQGAS